MIGIFIGLFFLPKFFRRELNQREEWMLVLSLCVLTFIVWAQKGWLGYYFSLYISPQIRSNYRVSIFITTAGLLAFYIWISPYLEKIKLPKKKWLACCSILLVSLLDQGGLFFPLNPNHETTSSDRQFAKQLKASLGEKPMLKLPFGAYPEWSGYMSVEIYSPFRYLMAEKIHSVFPSIKGTRNLEEQWPLFFGKIPEKKMLLDYGIAGVVIDKDDYPDKGQTAEAAYTGPNSRKFSSPNGRFVFIDLRD